MYWLAATAAIEPFAFEPHIAGSFGDCGALLHFDPRVASSASNTGVFAAISPLSTVAPAPISQAEPFYINAEYLIDVKKIRQVGDFTGNPHNNVTSPIPMIESSTKLVLQQPWLKKEHGFYPCGACTNAKCTLASEQSTIVKEVSGFTIVNPFSMVSI